MIEKKIYLEGVDPVKLFGINNSRFNAIKSNFPKLKIIARGSELIVKGMFGLMFSEEPSKIISIKSPPEIKSFSSFSVFADAACRIAKGEKPESLGKVIKEFQKRVPIRAAIDKSVITGTVIYIDSFRNAITNITRDLFDRVGKDRTFEIFVQSNHYKLTRINTYYHETTPGEILALFNSVGLLEIAINKGNAADLLNLSTNSTIRVKFKEKEKK